MDVRVLAELVGDEPEVVQDFLRQYLASARRIMAELRAGHAAGDCVRVSGATHKLKSSSRAIGAPDLGDLCARVESAAVQRHEAEVAAAIPVLEQTHAAVECAIAQLLGSA